MADLSDQRFRGESSFLRVLPVLVVALALYVALQGEPLVGVVLAVGGYAVASMLPWRFAVHDDGIVLYFTFGRRCFLPRDQLVVRVDRTGGVAVPPDRRIGYPLSDGLVERRTASLRAVLQEHGYHVT